MQFHQLQRDGKANAQSLSGAWAALHKWLEDSTQLVSGDSLTRIGHG
jgi:hypothetical protein